MVQCQGVWCPSIGALMLSCSPLPFPPQVVQLEADLAVAEQKVQEGEVTRRKLHNIIQVRRCCVQYARSSIQHPHCAGLGWAVLGRAG